MRCEEAMDLVNITVKTQTSHMLYPDHNEYSKHNIEQKHEARLVRYTIWGCKM